MKDYKELSKREFNKEAERFDSYAVTGRHS